MLGKKKKLCLVKKALLKVKKTLKIAPKKKNDKSSKMNILPKSTCWVNNFIFQMQP
jgi:hypothetical protein